MACLNDITEGKASMAMHAAFQSSKILIDQVGFNEPGLKAKVAEHLARGQPILCPCPSPGPYAIIAAEPAKVNNVKGRPEAQAVARLVGSLAEVEHLLAMDHAGLKEAEQFLEVERMTCLFPIKKESIDSSDVPILGGHRHLRAGLDVAPCPPAMRELCPDDAPFALFYKQQVSAIDEMCSDDRPLYVSSGNAHSLPMGQSFQDVVNQFKTVEPVEPIHLLAINGDHLRIAHKHDSTSMVCIRSDGQSRFTRKGYHHVPENEKTKNWRLTEEDYSKWVMR